MYYQLNYFQKPWRFAFFILQKERRNRFADAVALDKLWILVNISTIHSTLAPEFPALDPANRYAAKVNKAGLTRFNVRVWWYEGIWLCVGIIFCLFL